MNALKKIIIFFYGLIILFTIIILNKPIKTIKIHPTNLMVESKLKQYYNQPFIYLNRGIIQYYIKNTNRFFQQIKVNWQIKEQTIAIEYIYNKPCLLYNNYVVTKDGKFYNYESSLLLPTVNHKSIGKNWIPLLTKLLFNYFSIQTIKAIDYINHQWIIIFRNEQIWYLGYDLNKILKYLQKYNVTKKQIKIIINGPYKKIFINKKGLLLKNK